MLMHVDERGTRIERPMLPLFVEHLHEPDDRENSRGIKGR